MPSAGVPSGANPCLSSNPSVLRSASRDLARALEAILRPTDVPQVNHSSCLSKHAGSLTHTPSTRTFHSTG
jgi:hypothetical protein